MAKTSFSDGSYLTPVYMNSIYGTGPNAGHNHLGLDQDGSAKPIDINLETTGTLLGSRVAIQARNYIDGLQISWNNATLQWTVSIAAGAAMDATNSVMMANTATFTKSLIDSTGLVYDTWVAGTGNGGCPVSGITPLAAGIWVHTFLIGALVDGVIVQYDAGFDTSVTAANLTAYVASYSAYSNWVYRRLGSVYISKTGGTYYQIVKFTQIGDYFVWASIPTIYNSTVALTPSITTITSITPLGVVCKSTMHAYTSYAPGGNTIHIMDGQYPATTTAGHLLIVPTLSGAESNEMIDIMTGTSSDVYAYRNSVGNNPTLVLHGIRYHDFRGKS